MIKKYIFLMLLVCYNSTLFCMDTTNKGLEFKVQNDGKVYNVTLSLPPAAGQQENQGKVRVLSLQDFYKMKQQLYRSVPASDDQRVQARKYEALISFALEYRYNKGLVGLGQLYIPEAYRSQGLGKKLIDFTCDDIFSHGDIHTIALIVKPFEYMNGRQVFIEDKKNEKKKHLIKLFESCGFRRLPEWPVDNLDNAIMIRDK